MGKSFFEVCVKGSMLTWDRRIGTFRRTSSSRRYVGDVQQGAGSRL
jgi:hypothetical protein